MSHLRVLVGVAMLGMLAAGGCRTSDSARVDNSAGTASQAAQVNAAALESALTDANAALNTGDYDAAMAMFREILAKNPTVATAYVGIGDIHMAQQDYAAAEPNYGRAARLEPRNFDAQYKHGLALQMLGRFVDAIRAYQRALVVRPSSHEANLNTAITYLQMGEARSARGFAEMARTLKPDDGPSRINLGAVYDQLGLYDLAIEEYLTAAELVDPTPELRMNIVNAYANAGRYQETINAAETLLRVQPSAGAWERVGWAWFRLKNYEKSIEAYRNAVRLDESHWPAWNGVGVNALNAWLLSEKQNVEARREAGEALRRSLRLNRDQPKIVQLISTYRL
ncbi:MAG: tetratricopeptide repeat protein [Phycisphaeraceae bacterium]|nr:tetratricopeptide repeat protein [Phycisphaerales bacterium]QOJ16710.1 MAG: tetratricopeptide repeat protein [Phycisphaeraceae bacterium]